MKYIIEGKLQFEEYFDSHKKAAQMPRSVLRTVVVLGGLFVVVLNLPKSAIDSVFSSWQLFFGFGLIVYGLVVSPLQFRYRVQRNWNRYPAAHRQQRFSFDNNGMTTIDDVGNPAVTNWDKFIRWSETKSSFMLYISPLLWIVVPKRLLGIERVAEFRLFLTSMFNEHNKANSADAKNRVED